MKKRDLHVPYDFFEYVRIEGDVPPASRLYIDVALLDLNHTWRNLGHDAIAHDVLEMAETFRDELVRTGRKVRLLSYDVRHALRIPERPNGRFQLYLGTGGPGHLDPRENDGVKEWSQGIIETDAAWEAPLFRLFDDVLADRTAAMLGICHSFGLICRWSGVASPRQRAEKSTGLQLNTLSAEAADHPWFRDFARELPDRRSFRVVDNRLFDLVLESPGKSLPIAFETAVSPALTMIELARDPDGVMPRFLGMNHHPEMIDREHALQVIEEQRAHGASDDWCRERIETVTALFRSEEDLRQSRLTSHYTLLEPLRFHLGRIIQV